MLKQVDFHGGDEIEKRMQGRGLLDSITVVPLIADDAPDGEKRTHVRVTIPSPLGEVVALDVLAKEGKEFVVRREIVNPNGKTIPGGAEFVLGDEPISVIIEGAPARLYFSVIPIK